MSETFSATVTSIKQMSSDKAIVRFSMDTDFSYEAGQYIEINIPGYEPRFYSIANAPQQSGEIEVHIKDNGRGGVGTYTLKEMAMGETVEVKGPFGSCIWHDTEKDTVLLLAGGMGVAPIKAIMEQAIAREYPGQIILYWGINDTEDLYLKEEIDALCNKHERLQLEVVMEQPVGEFAVTHLSELSETEIYIFGPPAMVKNTLPLLYENGAQKAAINTDFGV